MKNQYQTSYQLKPTNTSLFNTQLTENEIEVLRQLALGHSSAMDYLFDTYYEGLCNKALRYVKDSVKAEDIVQDIFLNIWKKRENLSIQISLKAYLSRCVTNRSLNHLRDNRKYMVELEETLVDNSFGVEEDIYYKETEKIISKCINRLSPRCRQVFIMNRIEQMKYKEIASELDVSVKTVEHHIAKALAYLRTQFGGMREMAYC